MTAASLLHWLKFRCREVSAVFPSEAPLSTLRPQASLSAGQSRTGSAGLVRDALGLGETLGSVLRLLGVPSQGVFKVWSVTESVHKPILTHDDLAWTWRVGTEKLYSYSSTLGPIEFTL